jgi:hypothetical protein
MTPEAEPQNMIEMHVFVLSLTCSAYFVPRRKMACTAPTLLLRFDSSQLNIFSGNTPSALFVNRSKKAETSSWDTAALLLLMGLADLTDS